VVAVVPVVARLESVIVVVLVQQQLSRGVVVLSAASSIAVAARSIAERAVEIAMDAAAGAAEPVETVKGSAAVAAAEGEVKPAHEAISWAMRREQGRAIAVVTVVVIDTIEAPAAKCAGPKESAIVSAAERHVGAADFAMPQSVDADVAASDHHRPAFCVGGSGRARRYANRTRRRPSNAPHLMDDDHVAVVVDLAAQVNDCHSLCAPVLAKTTDDR
jgi:hypothetical protein